MGIIVYVGTEITRGRDKKKKQCTRISSWTLERAKAGDQPEKWTKTRTTEAATAAAKEAGGRRRRTAGSRKKMGAPGRKPLLNPPDTNTATTANNNSNKKTQQKRQLQHFGGAQRTGVEKEAPRAQMVAHPVGWVRRVFTGFHWFYGTQLRYISNVSYVIFWTI